MCYHNAMTKKTHIREYITPISRGL